ncbi:hypothetical protein DY000_02002647 [Brassica cretica]|uniref:Uncharacterized protein n=1 Tax=Brassica cretica TaxID=69181 RepID=A0ABQ7CGL7_BRACR|nr:hypothetical protein DY000_02002647 [Brassica cretica]
MENLRLAASPGCFWNSTEALVLNLTAAETRLVEGRRTSGTQASCVKKNHWKRYGPWCLGFERRGARDWACGACLPLLEGSDIPNLAK